MTARASATLHLDNHQHGRNIIIYKYPPGDFTSTSNKMKTMLAPLSGIRVIEFAGLAPGYVKLYPNPQYHPP